jgi:hypothetical protein
MSVIKRGYKTVILVVVLFLILATLMLVLSNPGPTGPGPVEINVITEKDRFARGEVITFSIYVNNTHDWNVPQPSTITYQIGSYIQSAYIDYASPLPTFPAHSYTLLMTYSWNQKMGNLGNQTLVEPGIYTITVSLGGKVDYGPPGNRTITIQPS